MIGTSGPIRAAVIAVSKATENPARASDARVRSANTSKSCKSPRFERQGAAYKCIAGDLQYDKGVIPRLGSQVNGAKELFLN